MLHIGCQKNFPASTNILEVIDSRKAHKGLSKVEINHLLDKLNVELDVFQQ